MTNPCDMLYKLPRRRLFKVLVKHTGDTIPLGTAAYGYYHKKVWAHNPKHAVTLCDCAVLYCGEFVVEEIHE